VGKRVASAHLVRGAGEAAGWGGPSRGRRPAGGHAIQDQTRQAVEARARALLTQLDEVAAALRGWLHDRFCTRDVGADLEMSPLRAREGWLVVY
jgi:hypothetical protein